MVLLAACAGGAVEEGESVSDGSSRQADDPAATSDSLRLRLEAPAETLRIVDGH